MIKDQNVGGWKDFLQKQEVLLQQYGCGLLFKRWYNDGTSHINFYVKFL